MSSRRGGAESVYASGSFEPSGLAFNSAGNLFVGDVLDNNIYEIDPSFNVSTIASGLKFPAGLAIDSSGDVFANEILGHDIIEITPGGNKSVFVSGSYNPYGIAFAPQIVPEGSTSGFLAFGLGALFVSHRKLGRFSSTF